MPYQLEVEVRRLPEVRLGSKRGLRTAVHDSTTADVLCEDCRSQMEAPINVWSRPRSSVRMTDRGTTLTSTVQRLEYCDYEARE